MPPPTPRFAIVMTVRNNARYIRQAMGSLFPELGSDGEVVIVDALSSDGTTEILRELAREHPVRVIVEACTRGKGRHLGILSTGAPIVITQVDADVSYQAGALRTAIEEFERRGRRGLMVAFGKYDSNPGTAKFFVWDRAFYLSTGGYEDRNLHDDMKIVRKVLTMGGAHRFFVDKIGVDLQELDGSHRNPPRGWALARENIRIARVFHGDGWTFGTYLKFLWLTRRSVPRYLAAAPLALVAFLRKPLHLSPDQLNRMTPSGPSP